MKRFARYVLLDRLAQGGMAEIYRARLASVEGAGRLIVIKRIQAGLGANAEFLQMFRSEIKVMMGFNHPNIVQLYDFGEEEGQPYIAMELVDGKNLRQFSVRFAEKSQAFPIELATYIIEQASLGLSYAHTYRDKISGAPLNIVHRDISPQNILISYEGNVKVIDFGIAKASVNDENTRAGVLKGKPSYFSPEQINGDPLDGRHDIFSLGAVLWELLVGKKLFAGESDLAVLKLVEAANTHVKPPSSLNPKIPQELDYIVLRMLAKSREKRFQSALELQRALHKFLYSYAPEFNPSDLGATAKDLFRDEISKDRIKIQELNQEAEKILAQAPLASPNREDSITLATEEDRSSSSGGRIAFQKESEVVPRIEVEPNPLAKKGKPSPLVHPSPSSPSAGSTLTPVPPMSVSRPKIVVKETSSPSRKIVLSLVAVGVAAGVIFGPDVGRLVPGFSILFPATHQPASVPSEPNRTVSRALEKSSEIQLKLLVFPPGGAILATLNGKGVDPKSLAVPISLNAPLELIVEKQGFKTFQRQFILSSSQVGNAKEYKMEILLEPSVFGFISMSSTPSADAEIVHSGGTVWKKKTPFENEKFPAGQYSILLTNDVLGMEKKLSVTVEDGKVLTVNERLEIKEKAAPAASQ